jgi:hypothetical protein
LGTGPLVTAEPRALDFGLVRLRGRAATWSIKLINAGNRSSGALDLSIPAPFTATGTNCTELVAGANCELTVIFNPVAVGPTSGQLVVNGKNLGASPSVAVSGVGVPVLSLTVTPSPLILPDVLVGGTAEGQFTISTAGGAATFEAAVPSFVGRDAHEFSVVSSQCGEPLPANRGCTVNVRFSPKAAGTKQVVFVVHTEDQLGSAPLQASASGQILRPVFITPRRGDFPPTQVPSNGSSVTFTVQNLTGTDAKLAAAIEGPDAGLFSIGATTCPPMLTPGLACMVPVHFLPRQVGMFSASLAASMLSPGGSATDSVILVGQGVAPPPMAGFFVLPANATLRVMEPLAFRAVRVSPAGATQDLTTTAIWTSSNAPVATITAGGVAVGVSPGLAIITASATVDGVLLLARANLTVVR